MNAIPTRLAAAVLTLCVSAPALAAQADKPSPDVPWAKSQGNRAGLEFDLLSRIEFEELRAETFQFFRTIGTGLAFTAVGQIRVFDWLYVDVEVPVAFGTETATAKSLRIDLPLPPTIQPEVTKSGFAFGNPTLGAHYAGSLSPDFAYFAGITVSIPVLGELDEGELTATSKTALARAFFDTHRFLDEYVPIRARGGVEIRVLPILLYRGDLGVMAAIATGDAGSQTVLEQGNELEARAPFGLGGGLRFQEAFPVNLGDKVQTALEPFAGYEMPGSGIYARVGYLVALDEALGFGLNKGKFATLRIAAGAKF